MQYCYYLLDNELIAGANANTLCDDDTDCDLTQTNLNCTIINIIINADLLLLIMHQSMNWLLNANNILCAYIALLVWNRIVGLCKCRIWYKFEDRGSLRVS